MSPLEEMIADKLDEIAASKAAHPLAELEAQARRAPAPRGFRKAMGGDLNRGYRLIAEIKKATPSKGLIRPDFDPATIARAYEAGGATCLSVQTDGIRFQGAGADLVAAREASRLPVMRKDLILDPWQVAESRVLGADAILIIMAAVTDTQAAQIEAAASHWGMDVLIDVRSREEMERAARLKSPLLIINNKDPMTKQVDLDRTRALARFAPINHQIIAEGGLSAPADLAGLARYGVRSFVIGESLLLQSDIEAATRAILANPLAGNAGM